MFAVLVFPFQGDRTGLRKCLFLLLRAPKTQQAWWTDDREETGCGPGRQSWCLDHCEFQGLEQLPLPDFFTALEVWDLFLGCKRFTHSVRFTCSTPQKLLTETLDLLWSLYSLLPSSWRPPPFFLSLRLELLAPPVSETLLHVTSSRSSLYVCQSFLHVWGWWYSTARKYHDRHFKIIVSSVACLSIILVSGPAEAPRGGGM